MVHLYLTQDDANEDFKEAIEAYKTAPSSERTSKEHDMIQKMLIALRVAKGEEIPVGKPHVLHEDHDSDDDDEGVILDAKTIEDRRLRKLREYIKRHGNFQIIPQNRTSVAKIIKKTTNRVFDMDQFIVSTKHGELGIVISKELSDYSSLFQPYYKILYVEGVKEENATDILSLEESIAVMTEIEEQNKARKKEAEEKKAAEEKKKKEAEEKKKKAAEAEEEEEETDTEEETDEAEEFHSPRERNYDLIPTILPDDETTLFVLSLSENGTVQNMGAFLGKAYNRIFKPLLNGKGSDLLEKTEKAVADFTSLLPYVTDVLITTDDRYITFVDGMSFLLSKLATGREFGEQNTGRTTVSPNPKSLFVGFGRPGPATLEGTAESSQLSIDGRLPLSLNMIRNFITIFSDLSDSSDESSASILSKWYPEIIPDKKMPSKRKGIPDLKDGSISVNRGQFDTSSELKAMAALITSTQLDMLYSNNETTESRIKGTQLLFFSRIENQGFDSSTPDGDATNLFRTLGRRPRYGGEGDTTQYVLSYEDMSDAIKTGAIDTLRASLDETPYNIMSAGLVLAATSGNQNVINLFANEASHRFDVMDWEAAHNAAPADGNTATAITEAISALRNSTPVVSSQTSIQGSKRKSNVPMSSSIVKAIADSDVDTVAAYVGRAVVDERDSDIAAALIAVIQSDNIIMLPIFAGAAHLLLNDDWEQAEQVATSENVKSLLVKLRDLEPKTTFSVPNPFKTPTLSDALKKYVPIGGGNGVFARHILSQVDSGAYNIDETQMTVLLPGDIPFGGPDEIAAEAFVLIGKLSKKSLKTPGSHNTINNGSMTIGKETTRMIRAGSRSITFNGQKAVYDGEKVTKVTEETKFVVYQLTGGKINTKSKAIPEQTESSPIDLADNTAPGKLASIASTACEKICKSANDDDAFDAVEEVHTWLNSRELIESVVPARLVQTDEWEASMTQIRDALIAQEYDTLDSQAWQHFSNLEERYTDE